MVLINILLVTVSFLVMEVVAWSTHKYIMHGPLWFLHRDHHRPHGKRVFQNNDFFFLLFATPGIVCIYFGTANGFGPLFFIGLGISLYGLAYFLVHDIFIHQRAPWLGKTGNTYLKAVRRAHKIHHKKLDKENGECFGMLWVPKRFMEQSKRQRGA